MKHGRLWIIASFMTRSGIVILILLGALWPTYLNLRTAYNNSRIVGLSHGKTWETFYKMVLKADSLSGVDNFLPDLFMGTPSSFTIFGIPFVDPIVAAPLLISDPGSIGFLFPGLLAVLICIVVLGRGFCAFACPASIFFSFNMRLREILEHLLPFVSAQRYMLPDSLRWGLLAGGTITAVWSGSYVWNFLLPYIMVSSELVNMVIGIPLSISFGVIVFILLSDLILFPGEVCRAMCPLGLILGKVSKVALIRLRSDKTKCPDDCYLCETACDLSLLPSMGAQNDCNLCGRCVAACPSGKLSIGISKIFFDKKSALLFMISFIFIFVTPENCPGHHYKGLPHYGYFDNYPQVPTEEFLAVNGPWEMNFTLYNFQGMTRSDVTAPEDMQIFLIIYDLRRQKTFGGRAEISVFSGDKPIKRWRLVAEQESLYWVHTTISATKNLRLEASFEDSSGKTVLISSPFHLPGEGGHNPLHWVAGAIIGLMGLVIFTGKKKGPPGRRRKA